MREIKFKAKRKLNGNWVFGYYVYNEDDNKHFIYAADLSNDRFEIIRETLCQLTGLHDINNEDIYENDNCSNGGFVMFDDEDGWLINGPHSTYRLSRIYFDIQVTGNRHND